MKILELTGYKKNPTYQELIKNPDFKSFAKKAEEQGWKIYGSGGYGVVLRKPGNSYLYKLFDGLHTDAEEGYLGYAKWAQQNSNNPFVPNVSKPFQINGTAEPRKPEHDNMRRHQVRLSALYALKIEELDPAKGENDPRFKKFIDPRYKSKLSDDPEDWSNQDQNGESLDHLFFHATESLFQFNKDAKAVVQFAGDMYDDHVSNVMFRGDQLVFTDPVIG
jgi:hypothetical protein|tara:strand:+ start:315 stop:974 length:660 start_codon:yes stop_codon:yes gene_type:complete